MSYENELNNFKNELFSVQESTFKTAFKYEPPTTLPRFTLDGNWLESITSRYIAYSLSKLELAAALHLSLIHISEPTRPY